MQLPIFSSCKLIIPFIFRIIVERCDFMIIIRPFEVVRISCNSFMSSETRLYCTRVVNAHGYTPKVSSNNYIPRKVLNILLPRIFWFFPPSIFDVIWECQEFSLHLLKTFKCEYKICFRIYSPRDAWFCGYHLAKKKKKKSPAALKASRLCVRAAGIGPQLQAVLRGEMILQACEAAGAVPPTESSATTTQTPGSKVCKIASDPLFTFYHSEM